MGWGEARGPAHPALVSTVEVAADGQPMIAVRDAVTDEPVKCPECDRTVAWRATRPYSIRCRHCRVDVTRD